MHEFSLAQGLMDQLLQLADRHNATRIITVRVTIGRLSGIVTDSFSFGFESLAGEHDLTKEAVLEITTTEPAHKCLDCDYINTSTASNCTQCNSIRLAAKGGDDLILNQVEME